MPFSKTKQGQRTAEGDKARGEGAWSTKCVVYGVDPYALLGPGIQPLYYEVLLPIS